MSLVIYAIAEQLEALLSFKDLLSVSLTCHSALFAFQRNAVVLSSWKRKFNANIVGAGLRNYVAMVNRHCRSIGGAGCAISALDLQRQLYIEPMAKIAATKDAWIMLTAQMRAYEETVEALMASIDKRSKIEFREFHRLCAFLSDHYDAHVVQKAVQKHNSPVTAMAFAFVLYLRNARGVRLLAMERVFFKALGAVYSNMVVKLCASEFGPQTPAGSRQKDAMVTTTWSSEHCFSETVLSGKPGSDHAPFATWRQLAALAQPTVGVKAATISVEAAMPLSRRRFASL